jgi:hypothetical protein
MGTPFFISPKEPAILMSLDKKSAEAALPPEDWYSQMSGNNSGG